MINGTPDIYLSTDVDKICELANLLASDETYTAAIFDDDDILYVALGACRMALITCQQYATLAQIVEFRKHYGKKNITIHSFLDNDNQLTAQGSDCLARIIDKKIPLFGYRSLFTKEHIEVFISKLKQLPLNERIFMHIPENMKNMGYREDFDIMLRSSIFEDPAIFTLLSMGAIQAFIDTVFSSQAFKLEFRFGKVTIDAIEKSMRNAIRIISVYYPHPKPRSLNPRFFHKRTRKAVATVGQHDIIHAILASIFPIPFRQLVSQIVDLIRDKFAFYWSSTIWDLVDFAHEECLEHIGDNNKMLIALFKSQFTRWVDNRNEFSPEMGVVILDIFLNPSNWIQYGISFETLKNGINEVGYNKTSYNFSYINFLSSEHFFERDDTLVSLVKLSMISAALQKPKLINTINTCLSMIEDNKNDLLPKLTVRRILRKNNGQNEIHLFFDNQPLNTTLYKSLLTDASEKAQLQP